MNDFLSFLHFHENRRSLHCFHRRYEFCMQNYPSKCIFIKLSIEGTISANFIKGYSLAILTIFSTIWKFLILLYLSSFPSKKNILWLFVTILLKSFSENLKQLTKINDFLLFFRFHENRRIIHCFHRRCEFRMQKYLRKCIFIEFP